VFNLFSQQKCQIHSMRTLMISFSLAILTLFGCEKTFQPEISSNEADIVVEGYIEAGESPTPPYVILTRSVPFFASIGLDELNNLYVRGADVRVSDGQKEVQLREICLQELSPDQRQQVARFLGFNPDSLALNVCAYVDLSLSMLGEEGKTYTLKVKTSNQSLSAVTAIPRHARIDSLKFITPAGKPNDTLAELRGFFTDPSGVANFYRYQTQVEDGPFLSPIRSVTDDRLFDGRGFEFPLSKAEPRNQRVDPLTFGLYRRGDSVSIKWITLDRAHFDFWNTVDFNAINQGPFASYTRIKSNVKGGLGIWGGLSASYYRRRVRVSG
jgi:hypothetical protein